MNVMLKPSVRVTLCRALIVALLAILSLPMVVAQSSTPVLVELFTSEGCSSCPPADALLRRLDASQPVSGVQLIVLGEHVDYWDDQGWRDVYSDHDFTVRQQNYVNRLRLQSPYTPQMVVDGSVDLLGSDSQRANQAFEKARTQPKVSLQISSVSVENGVVRAHIESSALPSAAELFVALALDHAESQVLRGENGGHRLEHVAVALNLTGAGKVAKDAAVAKDVRLKTKPSDAGYRLIAFVQEPNQGKILGVAVQLVQK
jgi:hypothetical protein